MNLLVSDSSGGGGVFVMERVLELATATCAKSKLNFVDAYRLLHKG